jgi:hypothetical protein
MEITYRNKPEDFAASYDYLLKETAQGRNVSKWAFDLNQGITILLIIIFSLLLWGISASWKFGLVMLIPISIFCEGVFLLKSSFKPRYYYGKLTYKRQEASFSKKDLENFCLPKTIKVNNDWIEIESTEAIHRYRWRQIDSIGITVDFILVLIERSPIAYIPKRDFSSEQSFIDFAGMLSDLQKKNQGQPIGYA